MDVTFEHRAEGLLLRVRFTPAEVATLGTGRQIRQGLEPSIDLVDVMAKVHDRPGRKTVLARVEVNVMRD